MKDRQDLHIETTLKSLLREIKDLNKRRDIPHSWTASPNIVKISIFLRSIESMKFQSQLHQVFF